MSVKVPAIFEDSTGTIERLTGEIELFGSVVLPSLEQITGNAVTIADGGNDSLTWNTPSGASLLNLAVPGVPTVVTAGVYAVTVTCTPGAITAAGYYTLELVLDGSQFASVSSPAASAADPSPVTSLSCTSFISAGGQVEAAVTNHDGSASVDFTLTLGVVQAL